MKILVIESSPHKKGSSNMLAGEFMRGAAESGHSVSVFDAARPGVEPCLGCDACGMAGKCVRKDGMEELKDAIRGADMLVFVTPLYYFNVSAQLKAVIDRFYSFNGELIGARKKSAFICAAWNSDDWTMQAVDVYYKTLCRYLEMRDCGSVLATGCGTPEMTKGSPFMAEAYRLGKSL
jgi:multimeric flavodoxin WrbA